MRELDNLTEKECFTIAAILWFLAMGLMGLIIYGLWKFF